MLRFKHVKELREEFTKHMAHLQNHIEGLEVIIKDHLKGSPHDFVECEKCGCLLTSKTAIKGTAEVRQKGDYSLYFLGKPPIVDYIYYPYYCKIHAPKVKK